MFEKHLTLLIIPEEGGKTHEFKVPRVLVWLVCLTIPIAALLIGLGLYGYAQSRDLEVAVDYLEREKAVLEAEVDQIDELEQVLMRLQRSNEQLRAILSGKEGKGAQGNAADGEEPLIAGRQRLQWGFAESVPTAWPLAGPLARPFSEAFPAVIIGAVEGSPVCASGGGFVVRAGYDEVLGQLVVVDHGNGIETHYGYNSHLFVAEGDYVIKGQNIALSGRSGSAPYEGLYYALKEGRAFRDPGRYRLWL